MSLRTVVLALFAASAAAIFDASDGSGSKLHKWKKSLQAEAKAAYDAHVASGVALDSKSRSLGVRGNGVSYWVHDMYLNNATAGTTPDMCGGRMPATSFALALSPEHSKCEHDPMGGGSTRNVGCNHDNMFIEYYNTPDCTGEPYHYDHPMKTCEYDYESNKYIFNRCQVKYPFKDQAGALFTEFADEAQCRNNDSPHSFHLIRPGCDGEGVFVHSCMHNHGHADFYDDMTPEGRMCMGPVKEVFDKKFTPNGYFHCHHEEPSSRKCANNHMYPPPPEQQ